MTKITNKKLSEKLAKAEGDAKYWEKSWRDESAKRHEAEASLKACLSG